VESLLFCLTSSSKNALHQSPLCCSANSVAEIRLFCVHPSAARSGKKSANRGGTRHRSSGHVNLFPTEALYPPRNLFEVRVGRRFPHTHRHMLSCPLAKGSMQDSLSVSWRNGLQRETLRNRSAFPSILFSSMHKFTRPISYEASAVAVFG